MSSGRGAKGNKQIPAGKNSIDTHISNKSKRGQAGAKARWSKQKGKSSDQFTKEEGTSLNHPATFEAYASILNAATAVNGYTRPIGRYPLPFEIDTVAPYPNATAGVIAVDLASVYTMPQEASDPINTAAQKLSAIMRSKNTGSTVYDPCDMMIYHLCGAEIISSLAYARTALGLIGQFSTYNGYYPKQVLRAYGWDFDDLRDNRYAFEGIINVATRKIGAWNFFGDLEFIKKADQVYKPILVESMDSGLKSQTYLYRPVNFKKLGVYNGPDGLSRAALEGCVQSRPATGWTVAAWNTVINEMIDALSQWTWTSIISGDIQKFAPASIFKFTEADVNYITPIYFDVHDLEQFMNLRFFNTNAARITEHVTSNGPQGYLKSIDGMGQKPAIWCVNASSMMNQRMVRTYLPTLSAGEVMDRTVYDVVHKFTPAGVLRMKDIRQQPQIYGATDWENTGLYLPVGIWIHAAYRDSNGDMVMGQVALHDINAEYHYSSGVCEINPFSMNDMEAESFMHQFKYTPEMYKTTDIYDASDNFDHASLAPAFPIDQFAFYDIDELRNIAFARNAIYFGL